MTSMLERMTELESLFAQANFDEIELVGPEGGIRLRRHAAMIESQIFDHPAALTSAWVKAPSLGVFLDRHPLQDKPLISIGQHVEKDAFLGYMRLQLVLVPVTAPVAGRIIGINVNHLDPTGYGDPLIEIEPMSEGSHGTE